jgi:hypothetical protein
MTEPLQGQIMRRPPHRQPSPWIADMIAAAYNDDEATIREADTLLSDEERRELHRAVRFLVKALFTGRLAGQAKRRMSLNVEPESGTPGNPLRLGGNDA